jgi:hypothetical protein
VNKAEIKVVFEIAPTNPKEATDTNEERTDRTVPLVYFPRKLGVGFSLINRLFSIKLHSNNRILL